MNDWSDDALKKMRKRKEDQRLKDAALVEKERLKKTHGPPLWHEVRRIVKENCEHYNRDAGEELVRMSVTQNTEIEVQEVGAGKGDLKASFDENSGLLKWNTSTKRGSWKIVVGDDGSVYFGSDSPGSHTTPASIANEMMNAMLFL